MREASVKRTTAETDIDLWLDLDGNGSHSEIHTGVGFLDHMLVLFSRHSGIEMKLSCKGDTWVDDHHSTEDIGIAMGLALAEALGDKKGIVRYASLALPMDEALILCAVDISGRGGSYTDTKFPTEKIWWRSSCAPLRSMRALPCMYGSWRASIPTILRKAYSRRWPM